jgi:predicted transcriptional regulator
VRKTDIRVEAADTFFKRGRKLARLADRKERISDTRVVAFEDVGSLLSVLREKRVLLLKEVKLTPELISALARRLKRDRSAVSRNI